MNKKLKILILEDSPSDAELIERELRKAKLTFTSRQVKTKKAFLKELKQFAPDLIIADYKLPDFDGMSALLLAKEFDPTIPVIIATGSINEETAVECMKAGAADYVIKEYLIRLGPAIYNVLKKKKTEEEKQKLQAQLLHSQKMEAIGTLSGGVAHDFNNLLTPILGYTDHLMTMIDKKNPMYKYLKKIRFAGDRANLITRQLLHFSRKQPMKLDPININKQIDILFDMLKQIIGEDIVINKKLEPNLFNIQGDSGSITQIIMNISVNARNAMPTGGIISIQTENVYLDKNNFAKLSEAKPGQHICLSIKDTGIGMPEDIIQHIFEPFFTTADTGSGLGLSVVYSIVKQHGGWINVKSVPDHGSTFEIYFPASSEKIEKITDQILSLHELRGNGERILLVEDDENVRDFTALVFRENNYVVFEAASAKEAQDVFEKEKESIDLVFSDVILPDRTALLLVENFLYKKPELKIILTSGYLDEKSKWSTIIEKGYPYIQKPYQLSDLLEIVKITIKSAK